MKKQLLIVVFVGLMVIQPNRIDANINTNPFYVSISNTYNAWNIITSINGSTSAISNSNTYWGTGSMHLLGTHRIRLNLTAQSSDYYLTNNSIFKFSWYFTSKQFNYIGFLLFSPNNTLYIVSHFNGIFGNSSTSAIYQIENEQTNTWYEHQINLTNLYLHAFSFLPQKILYVDIVNANFDCCGLAASNQESFFDDFMFYSGSISSDVPNPPQTLSVLKEVNQSTLIAFANISWQKPTVSIGDVQHFNIYKSNYQNGNYSYLGTTTKLNFIDTKILPNKNYYYKIQSLNIFGESIYSQPILLNTTPVINSIISSTTIATDKFQTNTRIQAQSSNLTNNFESNQLIPSTVIIATIGLVGGLYTYKRKRKNISQLANNSETQPTHDSRSDPWYLILLLPIITAIGLMRTSVYHFTQQESLEHPIRMRIIQILEEYEFDHLNSLKMKIECRIATLLWHLQELERQELIEKEKYEQYTLIYLKGRKPSIKEMEVYIGLQSQRTIEIVDYLTEKSKANIKQVSGDLNLKPSIIKGNLIRFIDIKAIIFDGSANDLIIHDQWREVIKRIIIRRKKELLQQEEADKIV